MLTLANSKKGDANYGVTGLGQELVQGRIEGRPVLSFPLRHTRGQKAASLPRGELSLSY